MSELLNKWLAYYDPIHRGWTPRGIANGVCTTNGFFFPRVAGGFNLYRGTPSPDDVDTNVPVGAAGANGMQVKTFPWRPHTASTTYAYVLRSIGGGGVESTSSDEAVIVSFDASSQPEELKPNTPTNLAVIPLSDGRFEISWRYLERDQETPPAEFRVYSDGGSGTVDFNAPISTVPYQLRAGWFRFVTVSHSHGAVRSLAVRAASAAGATDGNSVIVSARADAQGPPTHPSILVETIDGE